MAKKIKKPEIRFKGFTDAWEQHKLSDIATMKARIGWQGLTQKEFLDEGDYYLITGTDFNNGTIDFTQCHYISKERYEQDSNIQIKNDDVLITKDGTIGKVAYIKGLDKPGTLNAGVFVIRGRDKNISNLYLYHYLAAPFLLDYADKQATGGTIKHLNQNVLVGFPVPLPSVDEQQKIGEYFSSIDKLITLHQGKYDKLIIVKKSMLEKMFPKDGNNVPEIRFNAFTDPWKQIKLSEIADKVNEKNVNFEITETFTNSAEYGVISQRDFFDHDIFNLENINGYYIVGEDDFVYNPRISATAPVGPINRNKLGRKGVMSPLYTVFKTHDIDSTFLEYFFKGNGWHSYMFFNGDTGARFDRFSIKNEVFFDMPIPYPEIEEQRSIGRCLENLDSLIMLHQRRLEKLRNIKESCMKKMFV